MNRIRDYRAFDYALVAAAIGLCVFGLIIIPSAAQSIGFPPEAFNRQRVWVVTGLFVMLAAAFINYEFICKFYIPIYIVSVMLLAGVIIAKYITGESIMREIGYPLNGRPRYVFSIMPSEFAKLFTVIFIAKLMDKLGKRINNFFVLCAVVMSALIPFGLIFMQPSLSASLVILLILLGMLYVGKLKMRYFIIAGIVLTISLTFFLYDLSRPEGERILLERIFEPYQINDRILPFIEPESADPAKLWQTERGMSAIRSGGLYGVGLYGTKIAVPEATNDFIFTIVASEFGFFGSMIVLAAGFFIVFKCLLIAWRCEIVLGRLIAAGVGTTFAAHIFINVGVVTGMLPNTGITFPFLSSGGSSVWISLASIGLVLNVKMTKVRAMFD